MRYLKLFGRAFVAGIALVLAVVVCSAADKEKAKKSEKTEPDVVFLATPQKVVDKMLEVAKVTKKDVVYDLGCGDGRIVCAAARKYGCKAVGIDIDPERIKESEANRAKEKEEVRKLITFRKADLFMVDLSEATVVTLYLLRDLNKRLIPQLKKLKDGSRIVSHAFDMKGVTIPDKGYPITIKGDSNVLDHKIYLWTTPLKFEKKNDDDD